MNKILTLIIFALVITNISYAQDISISADVDREELSLDDQLTLTITVKGSISNIPQPNIPKLEGFTSYSSGRSQSISVINGQVTSSVSFNYILVPNDVGDYTLGPFTIDYKGNTYSADPISVRVVPRSAGGSKIPSYTYPKSSSPDKTTRSQDYESGKELFIEAYVDKLRAYVNEQITLTFAFYQAVNLFENPVYNPPSTTGFWTEDMPPQNKYYKMIDGRKYLVTEIKTALFATGPGEFIIGPAKLEASVEDINRFFSRRSPFDIFDEDPFSMFKRGKPITLTTEPIEVEILPLPEEGKPSDFKGDVGRFNIETSVDKNTVEENQPVTLKIKIKGEGNIKTISSPRISEIPDAKFYDSGSYENISKDGYVVQGEKIFEKVIIPKSPGRFKIGPIEYSYFDPVARKYIEKKISPIDIDVTKSEEKEPVTGSIAAIAGLSKEEVKLLKKDIRYIKTGTPSLHSGRAHFYNSKVFLLVIILPALLLVTLYLCELHREKLRQDIGYARSRRAKGLASKRLKKARSILTREDTKTFYSEIYKATIEYVADKLNIPHASITKEILGVRLAEKGVSSDTVDRLNRLFDMCDMARFASFDFAKKDMEKALEDASYIISELERSG